MLLVVLCHSDEKEKLDDDINLALQPNSLGKWVQEHISCCIPGRDQCIIIFSIRLNLDHDRVFWWWPFTCYFGYIALKAPCFVHTRSI